MKQLFKVDLFIVGAAKSGTTSVHEYLNQHPDIVMSQIKEPNFFSHEYIKKDNLYYVNAPLIKTDEQYFELFSKDKKGEIYGESSVSYLYYNNVANKIYDYNPSSRILIFLRNPIERAFSHYLMDYSAGYYNYTFSELIRNKNINSKAYQQVILYGFYYNQLKRFLDIFPEEQIKICITEEAFKNVNKTIEEIEVFLGVEKFNNYTFSIQNQYQAASSPVVAVLYRSLFFKSILRKLINKDKINKIKNVFLSTDKPTIEKEDYYFLKEIYKKDIEQTSELLKKDLTVFWK